jgi:hypothetical protein
VARRPIVITVSTTFEIVHTGGAGAPVVAVDLCYSTRSPFALSMSFPGDIGSDIGSDIGWMVARDLMTEGLVGPSGLGDVRFRPLPAHPDLTMIELISPTGHALLRARTAVLAEFLQRSYRAVPPRTEHTWVDFDRDLSDLLDGPSRGSVA